MSNRVSKLLATLNLFATVLQQEKKPWQMLSELAYLVRDYARADHAKVMVVQRMAGRPGLEQLCRTDEDMQAFPRNVVPISENGLANWVVRNNDWLIVEKVPEGWPKQSVPFPVITGRSGRTNVTAVHEGPYISKGHEQQREPRKDNEQTMLMVPIGGDNNPAGVLALWRDRPIPGSFSPPSFHAPRDAKAILKLAPFVAAACQLVLQHRPLEDELKAVNELSKKLYSADSLAAAYAAIAEGVGGLGAAAHALLLHPDPDRPGHLYHRAAWSANRQVSKLTEICKGLHVRYSPDSEKDWREIVCAQVAERLEVVQDLRLVVLPARLLAVDEDRKPVMVAVLLDEQAAPQQRRFFAEDRARHAALSFLHYAVSMLRNHLPTYAQKLLYTLGTAETASTWGPDQVLRKASELLRTATAASATLVYSGPATDLRISSTTPENAALLGQNIRANSLTRKCVEEKRPFRVIDTGDSTDEQVHAMDRLRLADIRLSYDWKEIRSWLVCPVLDRGRCVGVLKLLTADRDGFLGKDHEDLAERVAERAAWEIRKLNRRLQLEELNNLANELTQARGPALGDKIISKLRPWVARYIRTGVEIGLFARTPPDQRLTDHTSPGIRPELKTSLRLLSRQLGYKAGNWKPNEAITLPDGQIRFSGGVAALPIQLPGPKTLQGHLMLLHAEPFGDEEQETAQEATREIGIVLHSERLNRHWQEQAGRFRHAVLGPVQGLQSTALYLMANIPENLEGMPEELEELRNQILKESELIRVWRNNQRLYAMEKVEIKPRIQPFKEVFDRCLRRSEPLFSDRGVRLSSAWKPFGQAHFAFDEAGLDLVLSNLLDNARKYAYRDTEVIVGLETTTDELLLWVEDIGHPIPPRLENRIYDVATRLYWGDPFRTIEGQGLGLPMAKAIVEAHRGKITHRSTLYIKGQRAQTTQYKVRFTVKLPLHPQGKG